VEIVVDGPYFEDLQAGQRFLAAPVTLTDGLAAAHQAVVGARLALTGAHLLSRQVLGDGVLAAPNLVWDVAIGQSTVVTQAVVANLFYRGVVFHRAPRLGDSLRTVTEVVGLRQNSRRPGRRPTGLVALRISTDDQYGRPVLDFWRCAMLPLRDAEADTGHADDLTGVGREPESAELAAVTARWDLAAYRAARPGPHFDGVRAGDVHVVAGGDVVTSAPELARLTGNVARVHHDARHDARHGAGHSRGPVGADPGGRLVYGGHTIGLALHQAVRALPDLLTVAGWHGCDHLAPVREGDTLTSTVTVERTEPLPAGGGLAHLRSQVRAWRDGDEPTDVLDWRFVAALA
jgi:acyl dehydratase